MQTENHVITNWTVSKTLITGQHLRVVPLALRVHPARLSQTTSSATSMLARCPRLHAVVHKAMLTLLCNLHLPGSLTAGQCSRADITSCMQPYPAGAAAAKLPF